MTPRLKQHLEEFKSAIETGAYAGEAGSQEEQDERTAIAKQAEVKFSKILNRLTLHSKLAAQKRKTPKKSAPKIPTLGALKFHLRNVIDYNWADEEEDYKQNPCPGHIFLSLQALGEWLEES